MSHPRGRRSRTVSRQTEPGAGAALTLCHESLTRPAGTAERALSSTSKSNLALSGSTAGSPRTVPVISMSRPSTAAGSKAPI